MRDSVSQPENQERRKHQRYPIQKNETVVVSPNTIVSFCLLDVSRLGLAFCYNGSEAEKWKGKKCLLDFLGDNFSMENAKVQIIEDQPFDPDKLPSFFQEGVIPSLRRCGVKFLELSKDQEEALDKYIKGLSSEYAPELQPSVVLKETNKG
jgi:c-di-GMP-binding flagellar brake protein YcgR